MFLFLILYNSTSLILGMLESFSNALIYAAPWTVSNDDFRLLVMQLMLIFYLNQSLPLTNLSRFRQYVFLVWFCRCWQFYG